MMRLVNFLTSLWGILTAAAVLFPGAAAILKLPIAVENSQIGALYPTFGSIIAAFSLLFLTAYQDKLSSLTLARNISTMAATLAIISLFTFVGIRIFALDIDYERRTIDTERNLLVQEGKIRGLILYSEKIYTPTALAPSETQSKRGDPWDLACLASFILMFSSLTVAFGSLGIHTYQKHRGVL
ncbi:MULTISPECIES: hypothetical protein [Pseudomonas]|uniref:DUF4149 domain-containing protein n=1 Tax=Pseudomonas wuhanensis TaxID=2954098 RepID=A0ABY9GK73_9PSED|nr:MULTISPECIES: hypothetical protein [unclassified Pseudomonas]WLI10346.1 hypothetical protein PSH65_18955 [Pseudomonas sp. FP603]WLI16157.1 hypothetical protein PSH88_17580 [Pseudomonas sp. FP607]